MITCKINPFKNIVINRLISVPNNNVRQRADAAQTGGGFKSRGLWLAAILISLAPLGFTQNKEAVYVCRKGEFVQHVILTGALRAREAERLTVPPNPQFQVKVKWLAPEGQTVNPGDIVVQLDNSAMLPDIDRLTISLRSKQELLNQKISENKNLQKELDINVNKAELELQKAKLDASIPKGVIDDHKYDRNQLALERAIKNLDTAKADRKARVNSMNSELEKMKIEIRQEQEKLDLNRQQADSMTLKAKTTGPVIWEENRWERRKVQVGDNVFTSLTIVSIPRENSLEVDAWLPENAINKVQVGQPVSMRLDANPGREFTGKVIKIADNAETVNQWGKGGYFRTRVSIDSLNLEVMKSGMSVQCVVETARIPEMLLIPLEYARFSNGKFRVQPKGKEPCAIEPTGFNFSHLALKPNAHPDITENTILENLPEENTSAPKPTPPVNPGKTNDKKTITPPDTSQDNSRKLPHSGQLNPAQEGKKPEKTMEKDDGNAIPEKGKTKESRKIKNKDHITGKPNEDQKKSGGRTKTGGGSENAR